MPTRNLGAPAAGLGARAGPFVFAGTIAATRASVADFAQAHDVLWSCCNADAFGLRGSAVAEMEAALRDNLYLRTRRLEKCYQGRIVQMLPAAPARGALDRRLKPTSLSIELETEDDRRTLQLEGSYAAALDRLGAGAGDIVQVAQRNPLVALRRDLLHIDGQVADDCEFIHRARLGDQDRSWPVDVRVPSDEVRDAVPAATRLALLGTGARPLAAEAAMIATDAWVRARLGEKGSALEPGILILSGATQLHAQAAIALREAVDAGLAPVVVLQVANHNEATALRRTYPDAVDWPHA